MENFCLCLVTGKKTWAWISVAGPHLMQWDSWGQDWCSAQGIPSYSIPHCPPSKKVTNFLNDHCCFPLGKSKSSDFVVPLSSSVKHATPTHSIHSTACYCLLEPQQKSLNSNYTASRSLCFLSLEFIKLASFVIFLNCDCCSNVFWFNS